MIRTLVPALLVGLLVAAPGCQPKVVHKYVPVPLPLAPSPARTLTVVGTGDTAEEAREAAMHRLVHQVILLEAEPENEPASGFVESMIRGYNIVDTETDLLGDYYVTIELPISQLGVNYQELYNRCQLYRSELETTGERRADAQRLRELEAERHQGTEEVLKARNEKLLRQVMALQQRIDELTDADGGEQ